MKKQLKEGVDYYFNEKGLLVFTAAYLLQRGYCCGNGCRHCPYEYENVEDEEKKKQLLNNRDK